ncbi:tetratricopeptide repeat protein [Sphingomonas parva]|uniref:Tetratricopeptide repeat protein n=1 Tax=Sphingomonas parva TaxID=2555898 RepID=A0A4Y8ZNS9_9SPHN|nr:transglutaminase-like domain-containing protein [Sphingomonas parva]TFI57670.1 tetratricopeptide repeat protein [Sphingomonas parva]
MTQEIAHLGLVDDELIAPEIAALEIAALDHPDVDLSLYLEQLAQMAEALQRTGDGAESPAERALALAEVIGADYGFDGDRKAYDARDNADFIRVLDRRLGLPVSLSILYVGLARRIGWSADALNTPGHVLIRVGDDEVAVLVDPFNGGTLVGADRLATLLSQALGADVQPGPEHLSPMSNRAMLVRLLLNEASRAEAAGDHERALTLHERMTIIAPGNSQAWWERARLELQLGDLAAARASLSAMLEMTREPQMRAHISAALDALAKPTR